MHIITVIITTIIIIIIIITIIVIIVIIIIIGSPWTYCKGVCIGTLHWTPPECVTRGRACTHTRTNARMHACVSQRDA